MTATDTKAKPGKPDKKAWKTDQEVRWCPGCGDYAILNAVQQTFAELGFDRDKTVIVSGIGCSSRFPYYMNCYGFHTIHGRAPALATGLKIANPELDVWVVSGDGDSMSIGGNHLAHFLRRDVGINLMMFNNRIYGLTKGQYSPTSEQNKVTKSTPIGSLDRPFNPLSFVLGTGASFVARGVDIIGPHLRGVLKAAHAHRGASYVEIWQNCNIFNDKAFEESVDRAVRDQRLVDFRHGEALVYGKDEERGVVLDGARMRGVVLGEADENGRVWTREDCVVWNAEDPNPSMAFMAAQLGAGDDHGPAPIGVLRAVPGGTPYEELVHAQIEAARTQSPERELKDLLETGECWDVV